MAFATALAVAALALVPSLPAIAGETWNYGALNCGSQQVLTSMRQNSGGMHQHHGSSGTRIKNVQSPSGYTWSYYNSGYTSINSAYITSNGDISNGSRTCDW